MSLSRYRRNEVMREYTVEELKVRAQRAEESVENLQTSLNRERDRWLWRTVLWTAAGVVVAFIVGLWPIGGWKGPTAIKADVAAATQAAQQEPAGARPD